MELKQIKELMASMERLKIKKITIKEKDGFELHLEKEDKLPLASVVEEHPQLHQPRFFPHHGPFEKHAPPKLQEEPVAQKETRKEEPGIFVTSPMVGTYYSRPSPEEPPCVKVGDIVDENTVVCIIEAMKVMNEVKAGMKGTVAEILVENGHPVEFGTKIVRVVSITPP